MRAVICYYSRSGNTKLACQYVARKLKQIQVDLLDITKGGMPDLNDYDIVGFAAFTDFWGPPYLMQRFIEELPAQKNKPAFVLTTYGYTPGKLLKTFDKWVSGKGFLVVGGHGLHTPESYPPMVAKGRGFDNSPNEKEMARFNEFITELNEMIAARLNNAKEFSRGKIKIGLLFNILPSFERIKARRNMGDKFVDEALCDECGVCEKACPHKAIRLAPKPVFDMDKCYGCWECFNKRPEKAIYTNKFRGKGHYPKPSAQLERILGLT